MNQDSSSFFWNEDMCVLLGFGEDEIKGCKIMKVVNLCWRDRKSIIRR